MHSAQFQDNYSIPLISAQPVNISNYSFFGIQRFYLLLIFGTLYTLSKNYDIITTKDKI